MQERSPSDHIAEEVRKFGSRLISLSEERAETLHSIAEALAGSPAGGRDIAWMSPDERLQLSVEFARLLDVDKDQFAAVVAVLAAINRRGREAR